MSVSMFTVSAIFALFSVVCSIVVGMRATVKVVLLSFAIVRLMPLMAIEPFGTISSSSAVSAVKVISMKSPFLSIVLIVAVPSMWPCTMWPPKRAPACMARSRLMGSLGRRWSSVDFESVSLLTSKSATEPASFVMVRHVPLTAMLSPSLASSARCLMSMVNTLPPGDGRTACMVETASIMPVNILRSVVNRFFNKSVLSSSNYLYAMKCG